MNSMGAKLGASTVFLFTKHEREKGFEPSTSTLARWQQIKKHRQNKRKCLCGTWAFMADSGQACSLDGCEKGCEGRLSASVAERGSPSVRWVADASIGGAS